MEERWSQHLRDLEENKDRIAQKIADAVVNCKNRKRKGWCNEIIVSGLVNSKIMRKDVRDKIPGRVHLDFKVGRITRDTGKVCIYYDTFGVDEVQVLPGSHKECHLPQYNADPFDYWGAQ